MTKSKSLVGQFFHSHDAKGQILWQGQVIGNPRRHLYLITTFGWMSGDEVRRLVTIDQMLAQKFEFYESNDEMKDGYQNRKIRGHADKDAA